MRRWATETGMRGRAGKKARLCRSGRRWHRGCNARCRENFKAGHRVRFRIVAQEKIADLLIGVGEMGVRLDPDKTAERGAGAIVERVFVKKIAGGMRRYVILQCAGIKLLSAVCDRKSQGGRCVRLRR